jgi:DNA-binding LacI/PurR family transcriptional regulator
LSIRNSLEIEKKGVIPFMSGKKRITSVDVAREAGVSQSTVSFVLNNDPRQTIPEDTRARVIEAARKLDYHPYAPARLLRTGKSKIVLAIYQESVIDVGLGEILEELVGAVEKLGFSLVWQIGFSPERDQLSANLAPAVVVWLGDDNDAPALARLSRYKAPIVTMLAGRIWFEHGARLQVEYLLKQERRPIVYAATGKPQLQSMSYARLDLVRRTCVEHGLPEPRVVSISYEREKARQAMADLLAVQPPPFAICAFNDDTAFAVLAALADLHISVPDEVSVIGHDNTLIADLSNPALTTIGIAASDLGQQLIASVLSVCQGGPVLETVIPEPKVFVRASA